MKAADISDDEWEDLEPAVKIGKFLPPVSLSLPVIRGKARGYLTFRANAADWVRANAPRFRVQIAGQQGESLRLVPDAIGGRYEAVPAPRSPGTMWLRIGHVAAWANEKREAVALDFRVLPGFLRLQLPPGFTAATPRAASTVNATRIIDRRPVGAVAMGEPPPERSALAQRKAATRA